VMLGEKPVALVRLDLERPSDDDHARSATRLSPDSVSVVMRFLPPSGSDILSARTPRNRATRNASGRDGK
jgi:hypothetical protein